MVIRGHGTFLCCATGVDWFPYGGDDDVMTMVTPGMSMVKSEPANEIDAAGPQPSTSGNGQTRSTSVN